MENSCRQKDLKSFSTTLKIKIEIISKQITISRSLWRFYIYLYMWRAEGFVDPESHIHCKWEFEFVKLSQKTVWHYLIKLNSHLH